MLYGRSRISFHFVGAPVAQAVRTYLPVHTLCSLLQVIGPQRKQYMWKKN